MNFYRITYKNKNKREFDDVIEAYNESQAVNKIAHYYGDVKIIKIKQL